MITEVCLQLNHSSISFISQSLLPFGLELTDVLFHTNISHLLCQLTIQVTENVCYFY